MNDNIIMSPNAMFISPLYNIHMSLLDSIAALLSNLNHIYVFEYIVTNKMAAKFEDLLKIISILSPVLKSVQPYCLHQSPRVAINWQPTNNILFH